MNKNSKPFDPDVCQKSIEMFSFTLESENWNLLKLDLEALRIFFSWYWNDGTHSVYQEALNTGAKIVAIVVILHSALCFQGCIE